MKTFLISFLIVFGLCSCNLNSSDEPDYRLKLIKSVEDLTNYEETVKHELDALGNLVFERGCALDTMKVSLVKYVDYQERTIVRQDLYILLLKNHLRLMQVHTVALKEIYHDIYRTDQQVYEYHSKKVRVIKQHYTAQQKIIGLCKQIF
jgi:hypothetical protein